MDGKATKLIKYLEGSDKRFIIPVYQRNYSWKLENCKQLFNDLVQLSVTGRTMHFFGSIVSVYSGKSEEFLIIDGQQRVTTVSLLLLAIHNILKEGKLTAQDKTLVDKVYNEYLVDKYAPSEKRVKLKASNKDLEAFERLFDDEPSGYEQCSDVTINYRYFYERILKEEISIDALFEAVGKLVVINITVGENDNPQLIFESLNSTGVDLTEGDKVRNFVLMGQKPEDQEILYKNYWRKIEACTGGDGKNGAGLSLFIRDYLSVALQSTPSMDKIYLVFKSFFYEKNYSIEELLKELLEYARFYGQLTQSQFDDSVVKACAYRLNYLESTAPRPFFLQVLKLHDRKVLTIDDLRKIFLLIEDYLFRRNICEAPTNALSKIFVTLDREIRRFDGSYDNYVEKMKYALISKKESGRFPDDREFSTALSEKQVYLMRGRYKNYLFERFENYGTEEVKGVFELIESGKYTIEHIMPQTLTPTWMADIGENYKEIHSLWKHRLANLTLTAYNSSYSNSPFREKRDSENGFRNSGLKMNLLLAKEEKWTLAELEKRDRQMVAKALVIWNYPHTEYLPEEKQYDFVSLDDEDVVLTNSQIAKFSFKGAEQTVPSWTHMYESVLKMLHSEDASVLTELAYASDSNMAEFVSDSPASFSCNVQIAPNIYVWYATGTQQKVNALRKFFKLFGVDPSELIFYLKDLEDAASSEDVPKRHEIRRKYWTYALPFIRDNFGEGGLFSHTNPVKDNWIPGFFGIGGCTIVCVANYNCARVEVYLGKSEKSKNKNAFEYLYKHKTEIENKLGEPVKWDRLEDKIASRILYEITGVSIENETDWTRMAKFHAEWSKKFFDVIVPLLKEFYPNE